MNKVLSIAFVFSLCFAANAQVFIGQLCLATIDSLPIYHSISRDTANIYTSYSAQPQRVPGALDLIDSNAFFVRTDTIQRDSILRVTRHKFNELGALTAMPFDIQCNKHKKWKLISIQDYGNYNPCCSPPYQLNNIFFLAFENRVFTSEELHQIFDKTAIRWHLTSYGEKYVTATYTFHYIMNDCAEGGTVYFFELVGED